MEQKPLYCPPSVEVIKIDLKAHVLTMSDVEEEDIIIID